MRCSPSLERAGSVDHSATLPAPRSALGARALSKRFLLLAATSLFSLTASEARARPTAPPILCASYPDSAACAGQLASCDTCHTSTEPTSWNIFGSSLIARVQGDFEAELPGALAELEAKDSDEDGLSNLLELMNGTNPGDAASGFCAESLTAFAPAESYVDFDYDRARRRVGALYCGQSPSYAEMQAFHEGAPDQAELAVRLHAALDVCLSGTYWRDVGLPRLADDLIRPVSPVGQESSINIVLGDYKYDYRLFAYVLTNGRDARELLTATYHVDASFQKVEGPILKDTTNPDGTENGTQRLLAPRRAGMITTEWFLLINTMFSDLPRTTAAQAYRGYLGMDISRQEGIWPVAGEPRDIDDKGVDADACAQCHSTLDPLAYAFAYYEGIAGNRTGTYDAERPQRRISGWSDNQAVLFGEPVEDVVAWAKRASESDAFKRNLATMFFRHAAGRGPSVADEAGLTAAWRAMEKDGHSANALIHRIVDLPAFGGLL